MGMGAYKRIVLGAMLLGTTAIVAPARAQTFDNQVNATALTATNTANVLGQATLGAPQTIGPPSGPPDGNSGIGNNIGAGAIGAYGFAGVNQTASQSTIQQGPNTQGGNSVTVQDISATNNTTATLVSPPTLASPATENVQAFVDITGLSIIGTPRLTTSPITATGGGIGNSIGATASGANAAASIVQSFDTNTGIDLTTLSPNQLKAGTITATNTAGSVNASLNPGQEALIGGGIGNSIAAQAGGALAGAQITSHMLDTTMAAPGTPHIATSTIKTGDIAATNRAAVTAIFGLGDPLVVVPIPGSNATIDNGNGNTIAATASGAFANASINQATDFTLVGGFNGFIPTAVYGNSVTTGSLTAVNDKGGEVTASLGVLAPSITSLIPLNGATIGNGVDNTIAAQASGAGAGGSIVQRFDNIDSVTAGGFAPGFGASNSVTTGAISALNLGSVSANAAVALPLIYAGTGNMIGATAVGASTGLGITQAISNSLIVSSPTENNSATLNAAGGMTALNLGAAIEATLNEYGVTTIGNGAGNGIGATAIGASTGATIGQSLLSSQTDMTSLGSNTVIVKDTGIGYAMLATNDAGSPVTATFQTNSFSGPATITISDGVANSISAQAVGAAVNASITSRLDNSNALSVVAGSLPVNSVDTTAGRATGLLAVNNGTVTALFGPGLGGPTGDLQIVTGVANNIGASAAGAAASAGINQSVSFDSPSGGVFGTNVATPGLFINTVKTGDIAAANTGNVTSTLTSPGNATIGPAPFSPNQVSGVGNSIAAQSVGASADASISSRFYNITTNAAAPGQTPTTNTIKSGDVAAINSGIITATAIIGSTGPSAPPANASIYNGIGNFIGASATGASAGVGITQSVSQAAQALSFDTTLLPANSITAGAVAAINSGSVNATLTVANGITQIGPAGAPGSFSQGNVGNSISAQAVGASASASITTQVFNSLIPQSTTLPASLATNTLKVASLSSSNSGPVTATASFSNNSGIGQAVSINGGVGNNIGASATGASSMASINQIVSTSSTTMTPPASSVSSLNTLTANTIHVGSITAVNTGNITATLVSTGGGLSPSISGGVGNSISANAVGASAGISITQSMANVH